MLCCVLLRLYDIIPSKCYFIANRMSNFCTLYHLNAVFEFNSAQDFTRYQQAIAAPVIAMLSNETRSRQDEIWNKVTEAAAKKYSDENGHVMFINDSLSIINYLFAKMCYKKAFNHQSRK